MVRNRTGFLFLALAAAACLQWPLLRWLGPSLPPCLGALFPGVSIVGAAFLLCWVSEAAEMDMPQGLAVILLALITVLPEYAVDIYFAWTAAKDPSYAAYAAANMTGGNRLLIGLGWPAVLFVYWLGKSRGKISLPPSIYPELVTLGAATVYACILPFKATLSLADFAVYISLFLAYCLRTAKGEILEPELAGPAEVLARLGDLPRRAALLLLFLFSAGSIYLAAEPFAEGLLGMGRSLGIDEFFLVQWLAPLASEAPELIVAVLFAWKGRGSTGLRVLVASKVNQWTLLIGMLPAAFCLSAGRVGVLPLDSRQAHEVLLTAAQSFFALALIINRDFSLAEGALLAGLFITQPFFTSAHSRNLYCAFYFLGGLAALASSSSRRRLAEAVRSALDFRSHR